MFFISHNQAGSIMQIRRSFNAVRPTIWDFDHIGARPGISLLTLMNLVRISALIT